MNTTYGQRLELALQLSSTDRQALANALDISVQAIGQVILGKTKALTADNSARAARFLNVDGYWLATGEGVPQPSGQQERPQVWPFARVRLDRVLALPSDELAFVESKLDSELQSAESRLAAHKSRGETAA